MEKTSRPRDDSAPRFHSMRFRSITLRAALLTLCVLAAAAAAAPVSGRQATGAAAQKAQAVYSCPMHPEVKAAKAGSCPKCGMTLQQTSQVEGAGANAAAESSPPARPGETERGAGGAEGRKSIPDLEVLDQDGRKVHFYTDLVKGKTVVINFIFTTCTTICPPLGATFARVQKDLGAERVGHEVHFISISVDPLTDTPERLKDWGAKFHAGPGWTFVTGDRQRINALLTALAASAARREDHSPTVLIINDATGVWTRTYGLAKPSLLVKLINDTIAGAAASAPAQEQK